MAKKMSLLLALGMMLATSGVAVAQPYPPQACSLSVSDLTVVPGQPVTVSGCGFAPGTPVNITFESIPVLLATILAPVTGGGDSFATSVIIPNDAAPGAHTIKATGQAADGSGTLVLSAPVQVAGAGTDTGTGTGTTAGGTGGGGAGDGTAARKGGGGLARTGSDALPLVQVGAALVLLGMGSVAVVHRRRNTGRRSQPSEA